MALASIQPLVKMSTRNIPGVKAAGAWVWLHHLHVPNVMKFGSLNLLEPSGPHRACYGTSLPLPLRFIQGVTNSSVVHDERKSRLMKRKYFEIAHQLS